MHDENIHMVRRLRLIAEVLDIPVERLMSGDAASGATPDARECLRLRSAIRTEGGRERALDCLRRIVEDEQR